YGGQHAHVIGGGPVNAHGAAVDAPPDVASSADHGHLHAELEHFLHLLGDRLDRFRVDPVTGRSGQRFAAHLQHDALVDGLFQRCTLHHAVSGVSKKGNTCWNCVP